MASSFVYIGAMTNFGTGVENWSNANGNSYFITLVSNNYVPSPGHSMASNFSGAELSSASFTAGFNGTIRISVTGRSVFSNTTSNQVEFRCADVSWQSANVGVAHAFIILAQRTNDANSPLIAYVSTGGFPITTNGGNFVISFANSGVFQMAPA